MGTEGEEITPIALMSGSESRYEVHPCKDKVALIKIPHEIYYTERSYYVREWNMYLDYEGDEEVQLEYF